MQHAWKRRAAAAVLAISAGAVGALASGPGVQAGRVQAPPAVSTAKSLYIVQMLEAPVSAYTGTTAGYAATKAAPGSKIDPLSSKVVKYAAHLDATHADVAARVGGKKVYDYRYAFNGFAAQMTETAAAKLVSAPGVVSVTKDQIRHLDTATTPSFLGLDAQGGIWEALGGPTGGKKLAGAGDGVVVGVLDTGIWPESLSFSDRDAAGRRVFQQLPGWHGKCTPGESFTGANCNQKLIGAQWFNAGFGGDAQVKADYPWEFASARDADSHGTHTASTAAGNFGVTANVQVADQVLATVSGMAPRARVAAYKVCWGGDEGGCASSDSVAAIDQAVADGVDVLNYSIGGTPASSLDPVEIAFMFAADAGVYVAASAGNSGPDASTVDHISPWLTTVAASTHNRVATGGGELGDRTVLDGASIAKATVTAPLVYSTAVALAGASVDEATLCYPDTLDPTEVAGKIVVCERGVIARTDKSVAVQQAGGVGMILVNVTPGSLNADDHVVPTVHVDESYLSKLRSYAGSDGATATIKKALVDFNGTAPAMAVFSSRGPALVAGGDVLKPDITAPGVDILAAVSPYASGGKDFDFLSGTSMSGPHIAGIGALMKDLHPTWSPMAIKSALMTSSYQLDSAGKSFGDAFDYGAGHVRPNSAMDPGLVYDSGLRDWLGFLCGGELGSGYCDANGLPTIDPSDLNQASIAIGAMAGTQTVTRTVTNVGSKTATYSSKVDLSGMDVVVSPATITVAPGKTASYTVRFTTNGDARLNEYTTGSITWTDGTHSVRSPVVVRPVAVSAPVQIDTAGDTSYVIGFGFTGPFTATARGLVPAITYDGTVDDDPANDIATALGNGQGITLQDVVVPDGTTLARFSLFDEFTSGNDDMDLYVFDVDGNLVGQSGSGTSAEQVDLVDPAAGTYTVVVHGWQTDGGATASFTLFSWAVGTADAGNMVVSAAAVGTIGTTGTIGLKFPDLEAGTQYLGAVDYTLHGVDGGSTIIHVTP